MCIYLSCLLPSGLSFQFITNGLISFHSSLQWPQLPLTSWQSRKVLLVSESLGPHPLHWGYRIYYSGGSSGGHCGSVDVIGGSTDNHTLIWLLNGLQTGASYTISIVGTSEHFFGDHVEYPNIIPLGEFL